jgi:phage-related protein
MVGMTMTAAFTVPIIGAFVAIEKTGKDASTQVAAVKKNLDDALSSGNASKIAQATAAWNALSPSVKAAASAYDRITAALQPVKDKLTQVGATLLAAVTPVILQLIPIALKLATTIEYLANWFSNLPLPAKDAILAFVGLIAIAGPSLVIFGKMFEVVGALAGIFEKIGVLLPTLSTAFEGLGTASLAGLAPMIAALAPVVLLGAAIGLLIYTIITLGPQAWTTLQQLATIIGVGVVNAFTWLGNTVSNVFNSIIQWIQGAYQWVVHLIDAILQIPQVSTGAGGGRAAGGPVVAGETYTVGENGPETVTFPANGYVTPHGGSGPVTVHLTFSPIVSMATRLEAETVLAPYLQSAIRKYYRG